MLNKLFKKIIICLIVFVLLYSNLGLSFAVIAESDEFEVITKGLFQKNELNFEVNFLDGNGRNTDKVVSDVNQKVKLEIKLKPNIDGFLKQGLLKAVTEDGSGLNFKFVKDNNSDIVSSNLEQSNASLEIEKNSLLENIINENTVSNTEVEKTEEKDSDLVNNIDSSNINKVNLNTVKDVSNTTVSNEIAANIISETSNTAVNNEVIENTTSEVSNTIVNNEVIENTTVDVLDNDVNNELLESNELNEKNIAIKEEKNNEYKIIDDNSIEFNNIIDDTSIIVEIEYVQNELLDIDSLLQNVKFQLSGSYINKDLEEVKIGLEETKGIGWKYSKEIEIESEYTKFSPFVVNDVTGTIIENTIRVKRDIKDNNYLPLKSNNIQIKVPSVNGKMPIAVEVSAIKLLASRGEDTGKVIFTNENWNYDQDNNTISINVINENNGEANYSYGTDEFIVLYRYDDYIDENSRLSKDVKVKVEEYSATINTQEKTINTEDDILVDIGELVTYSIDTNEEKISKGKINANYNSDTAVYEAEFTNNVSVKVLTSDLIEEIKLDMEKDNYIDNRGSEYKAEGIVYKSITFNNGEIIDLLKNDGEIIVTDLNDNVIGFVNKDVLNENDEAKINLKNSVGIKIYIKNIASDGIINFEVTKAIQKCNYEKEIFNTFNKFQSYVSAEVKYVNLDSKFKLKEISCLKEFENSITEATISMNRNFLSSMQVNDNVELKINFNNDKENSDLYINPIFEIVFPSNIKNVSIDSANVLYDNGLKIKDYKTYIESDIVKLRVQLEGTQKFFSDNNLTNGTNLLLNLNITLDEYTSAKQDQIKLYYYNEGATNYTSKSKWNIKDVTPNGLLKESNGFDATVFYYSTPNGLITVNTIKNYDGNLGEVKSVKQGEKNEIISMDSDSKVVTMELVALNNTGNTCTDVVFLGRIPFKGNKDIISKEDLKTTVDTKLVNELKVNSKNANITEIYYSVNAETTNDLDNIKNGWTMSPENYNDVKSYLIVVKGSFNAGNILRFSYDFVIPEKLPYESSIRGSFGAYYNNNSNLAVIYESSIADKVGLQTESGPKVEGFLSANISESETIGETRYIEYDLEIKNTGSKKAENVDVIINKPTYGSLCKITKENSFGNNNYLASSELSMNKTIDSLEPGESKKFTYAIKVDRMPDIKTYYSNLYSTEILEDEKGYYYNKYLDSNTKKYVDCDNVYLDSLPDIYLESNCEIKVGNLGIEAKSNTVKNKIVKQDFDLVVNTQFVSPLILGTTFQYMSAITNISDEEKNNVEVSIKLPENVKYENIEVYTVGNEKKYTSKYDEETRIASIVFEHINKEETVNAYVLSTVVSGNNDIVNSYFEVKQENGIIEKSSLIPVLYAGPQLTVDQICNIEGTQVKEQENLEFAIVIENTGNYRMNNVIVSDQISDNYNVEKAELSGSQSDVIGVETKDFVYSIKSIEPNQKVLLTLKGKAAELENTSKSISNKATISCDEIEGKETDLINLQIVGNENKVAEKPVFEAPQQESTENNNNNDQIVEENKTSNTESSEKENQNNVNNSSNTATIVENNPAEDETDDTTKETQTVSGYVWLDNNRDGRKDDDESGIPALIVQLYQNSNMLISTTTDSNGKYKFENLSEGKYTIVYRYDNSKYISTSYKKSNVEEDYNSDAFESEAGMAVTNEFTIENVNIENINFGLQDKKIFDIGISKRIVKATMNVDGKEEEYNFDNLELAKLEIRSSKINKTNISITYKIVVENLGNTSGKVLSIIDYIPVDTTMNLEKSEGWFLDTDGNAYNDSLKDIDLNPGENKELYITIEKKMSANNTGVISNRIELFSLENEAGIQDISDNNYDTQETLVLIKTGKVELISSIIISIGIVSVTILFVNSKKTIFRNRYKKNKKTKKMYR